MRPSASILITTTDLDRLRDEIRMARNSWRLYTPLVELLANRLRAARVVLPEAMPRDMITMNSCYQICDLRDDNTSTHSLVYPSELDGRDGNVSVFSPMGLASLGTRAGEFLWWNDNVRSRSGRVVKVLFQPEAIEAVHL